jgi:uroporphyrinogen decarboxylase
MVQQSSLKNNLLLKALSREPSSRIPVWMMRQAGRYLPEYRAIRSQYSFLQLCKTPPKAAEVSLQPWQILGVDAVIMFSDILIPLEPMGVKFNFDNGGPKFTEPIDSAKQVSDLLVLNAKDIENKCHFVYETINEIKARLSNEVPLLGFAGAPWTLASYMIEGGGSKEFAKIKAFMYNEPVAMKQLLEKLSLTISDYLLNKLRYGVDAVQLFDTWASVLSQSEYQEFALPYQQQIISRLKAAYPELPVILYVNGVSNIIDYMLISGADCLSVDWRCNLAELASYVAGRVTLQGNLDPCILLGPKAYVIEQTRRMLDSLPRSTPYIANLGHGILPNVPVENARAFVDCVKNYV